MGYLNLSGLQEQIRYIKSYIASLYAPKASPAFTGTPTAPTAASGTNTTQLATTAFVQSTISNNVYTKTAADNKFAEQSTTLAGYGITNAYTKTEVDNALSEIDVDIEDITSAEIASNWDNLTPASLAEYVTQEEMEDYVATVIATITNADQESY